MVAPAGNHLHVTIATRYTMKSTVLFTLSIMLVSAGGIAQEAKKIVDESMKTNVIAADTSKKGPWKSGGNLALNISQQNSSYWIGVSEKYALGLGLSADLYSNGAWGKDTWDNTLKANYALTNTESQGMRKTADFFDIYSRYGHFINQKKTVSLSGILNMRTRFSNGYDYTQDPKRRTSGFFAPANIMAGIGFDLKPTSYFSVFVSPVTARWVIVSNDPYSYSYPGGILPDGSHQQPIAEMYGVDPEKKVDNQFGAFVSANFNKEILKNVSYVSRLDLYSNYRHNPENLAIFWTNNLLFKVNKWLAFSYTWNLAYDDNYVPEGVSGPRVQFLGTLGIGATAKF